MAIKYHLSRLLGERKMKVQALSRQTRISGNALYKVYHEKTTGISNHTLNAICKALGCTVGELLEYVPDEE